MVGVFRGLLSFAAVRAAKILTCYAAADDLRKLERDVVALSQRLGIRGRPRRHDYWPPLSLPVRFRSPVTAKLLPLAAT
ncbi:hypothetical protein NKH70_31280 [Mesorhizobium sp. M0991]|uniref:hypothetical protein n=1 Tax=unclassified Mesorhizobium TaxID=325217 RepID=UPI00333699F4